MKKHGCPECGSDDAYVLGSFHGYFNEGGEFHSYGGEFISFDRYSCGNCDHEFTEEEAIKAEKEKGK